MNTKTIQIILLITFMLLSSAGICQSSESRLAINSVDFVRWVPQKNHTDHQATTLSQNRRDELLGLGIGTVGLEYSSKVHLNKDGTIREQLIRKIEYLNEGGVQSNGNLELSVDAYNQAIEIQEAKIISPNGSTVSVNPDTIQILTETTDNVFTDSYRIIIPWPSLEPGVIALLQYTSITQTAKLTMPWARLYFPQTLQTTEHFHVEVSWEEEKLQPNWTTDFDGLICDTAKTRHITCEGKKINPYKSDPDINYYDVLPTLMFSQPSSWIEINEKLLSIVKQAQSGGPIILQQLNQIIDSASSEEEKLASIHAFVSRDIRYLALSKGNKGIIPHNSLTTLTRRFGDCKDKTILFLDLARMADIDAYPVITSSYRQSLDKLSIPSTAYFDHMIACGKLMSGKEYCVDLTNPYSSYSTLPYDVQGTVSLKLKGESPIPERLPMSRNRWINRVKNHYYIDEAGRLLEEQERVYESEYAAQLRSILRGLGEREITKWAINDYHEKISETVDPKFTFQGINNQLGPVTIVSNTHYDNFTDPIIPLSFGEYKPWLIYLASLFITRNEHHSYHFPGFLYEAVDNFELNHKQNFENLGADLNFSSEFGVMRRTYTKMDKTVVITTHVDLPESTIPLSQIPQFNRFLKLITQQSLIRLFIGPQKSS